MTMRTESRNGVRFEAEGGGWVLIHRPEPGLRGATPAELLARTAALPGNLRYRLEERGEVLLFGEACGLTGGVPLDEITSRLCHLFHEGGLKPEPSEEDIEAALEASGFAWSRRETGWAIAAVEGLPRELHVRREPGGVRVEAVLADWDALGEKEEAALARFLLGAQAGLRFARCEWDEHRARIVSRCEADRLDADLPHSLLGVAAGCRLLGREAAALLVPEVAGAYLAFSEVPTEEASARGVVLRDVPYRNP